MMRFWLVIAALLLTAPGAVADDQVQSDEQGGGLVGIWDTPRLRLTFTPEGHMVLISKKTMSALSVSTYEVDGDLVSIQDITPIYFLKDETKACTTSQPGLYRVVAVGDVYMLSLRNDPCLERVEVYEQLILSPYVKPASVKHD